MAVIRKSFLSFSNDRFGIKESNIQEYAELCRYEKQIKTCPYEKQSNRTDMRRVFEEIEHINPEARYSIWHALEKEGKLISINDE